MCKNEKEARNAQGDTKPRTQELDLGWTLGDGPQVHGVPKIKGGGNGVCADDSHLGNSFGVVQSYRAIKSLLRTCIISSVCVGVTKIGMHWSVPYNDAGASYTAQPSA